MSDNESRIVGRGLARELSEFEVDSVAGGGECVRFTLYPTNEGTPEEDDTQLCDKREQAAGFPGGS